MKHALLTKCVWVLLVGCLTVASLKSIDTNNKRIQAEQAKIEEHQKQWYKLVEENKQLKQDIEAEKNAKVQEQLARLQADANYKALNEDVGGLVEVNKR